MLLASLGLSVFAYQKNKLNNELDHYENEYKRAEERQKQRYAELRSAMAENDMAKCRKLESKGRNECFLAYSMKNRTLDTCKEISLPEEVIACEDTINTINFVSANESVSKCTSLNTASGTMLCYYAFVDSWLGAGKPGNCDAQGLPDDFRAFCQDRFRLASAVSTNNVSDCNAIKEIGLAQRCKNSIKLLPADKDRDGLSDRDEKSYGLDFDNPDSDSDGLSDGDEINTYRSNPLSKDSDGDTLSDKNEITLGTNPINVDTDNDGFTDDSETSKSFNPCGEGALPEKTELKIACKNYYKLP